MGVGLGVNSDDKSDTYLFVDDTTRVQPWQRASPLIPCILNKRRGSWRRITIIGKYGGGEKRCKVNMLQYFNLVNLVESFRTYQDDNIYTVDALEWLFDHNIFPPTERLLIRIFPQWHNLYLELGQVGT